jgi:hypothetical protein
MTYNLLKNELGVRQVMGDRVQIPKGGYPLEVKPITIETKKGKSIDADLVVKSQSSGIFQITGVPY